jgi:ribulose-bisphosphate carboxylase small chain
MSSATMQDYKSSLGDPASRKFGTFSEPQNAGGSYWYMWKLPMFGETSVERVLADADACHQAHPRDHVRLVGYDNVRQTQGAAMVLFRGQPA